MNKDNYHEQGNIIIMLLLLPLGHISNNKMIMEPQDGDQRSCMILAISCHYYYLIACDVYHVFASCLLRTTVVNKMIPHNNSRKCSPLRQFVVSKHHVMIGCDRFQ